MSRLPPSFLILLGVFRHELAHVPAEKGDLLGELVAVRGLDVTLYAEHESLEGLPQTLVALLGLRRKEVPLVLAPGVSKGGEGRWRGGGGRGGGIEGEAERERGRRERVKRGREGDREDVTQKAVVELESFTLNTEH